jgi:hypothetical protein
MKLKILSIDFYLGNSIRYNSFWSAPSFSDYDVVVIDPKQISDLWISKVSSEKNGALLTYTKYDGGFGKNLQEFFNRRQEEISLLLHITGGIVICILRQKSKELYLYESGVISQGINNYNWFPESEDIYTFDFFVPVDRFGEAFKVIDNKHSFSQFFTAFKDNIHYEAIISGEILEVAKPLAANKVNELISCEVPLGKGKIIFLPPLKEVDDYTKVAGILIDCIRKSLQWTEPLKKPSWLTKYSLPNEERVKKEISRLGGEMRKIEKLIEEKEKELKSFEMIKSLLYEQGKYGLEPAVREAFRLLGFNVLNPEDYNEEYDLFIKEDGLTIIGEIEGSNKMVGLDKYRQLLDYTDRILTKGEMVKGILIGNGLTELDPEKRNEQFTDEAIRGCESKGFCRMTTFELFKAVRTMLDEPSRQSEIRQLIINCDKEFKCN